MSSKVSPNAARNAEQGSSECAICGGGGGEQLRQFACDGDYSRMLLGCFNIEWRSEKRCKICARCIRKLEDAVSFKKQVEEALQSQCTILNPPIKKELFDAGQEVIGNSGVAVYLAAGPAPSDDDDAAANLPFSSYVTAKAKRRKAKTKTEATTKAIAATTTAAASNDDAVNSAAALAAAPAGMTPRGLPPSATACPLCGAGAFATRVELVAHYARHFARHACAACDYSCMTASGLARHAAVAHGDESDRRFACRLCRKTYKTRGAVAQHIRRYHNRVKLYPCAKCPQRFDDYVERNRHLTEAHDYPARTYACAQCGREFARSSRLGAHVRRAHLDLRKHACAHCEGKFFAKGDLVKHMLKHTGIKDFKCEVCGKSYAVKNTLTNHMKIHDNLREHVCHICGKDFVQKCSLKSHLLTHAKE